MLGVWEVFGIFTHRVFAWKSRFRAYDSVVPDIMAQDPVGQRVQVFLKVTRGFRWMKRLSLRRTRRGAKRLFL